MILKGWTGVGTEMNYQAEYFRWMNWAHGLEGELAAMDEAEVEDAFYRNLAFGTGGLRGIIGAGTNRMNTFTVAKVSQGLRCRRF